MRQNRNWKDPLIKPEIKIRRRERDVLYFEGGIRDSRATCGMASESEYLKLTKQTTLLLLR